MTNQEKYHLLDMYVFGTVFPDDIKAVDDAGLYDLGEELVGVMQRHFVIELKKRGIEVWK